MSITGLIHTFIAYVPNGSEPFTENWPEMNRILQGVCTMTEGNVGSSENVAYIRDISKFERESPEFFSINTRLVVTVNRTLDYFMQKIPFGVPYDILVIGQTEVGQTVVSVLQTRPDPFLIIRFSIFYCGQEYGRYREENPPKQVGYHLDCPKDYQILYDLLTDQNLIQAVAERSIERVREAVEQFNLTHQDQPILIF